MRKITQLFIAISFTGFGQTTIDFEPEGVGMDWNWTVDANGSNAPLEFVSNPNPTAVNSTDVTAKFTASPNGQPWALAYTDAAGSITFTENNSLVKMSVLKTVATTVAIKFEDSTNPSFFKQIEVANTVTNGDWEELSFDFSTVIGNSYDRMVIIPDFLARSEPHLLYFDQISFNSGGAVEDYNLEDIDFEADGFGANWVWTVHNNHSNPALEIVPNPNLSSSNSSENVAKFTSKADGEAWALTFTDNIGTFLFNQDNKIVSLKVRKEVATNFGVKFEYVDPTNAQVLYFKELQLPTTVTDGNWEALHFDFSSEIGTAYNRLVIIPDFESRSQDNISYFDEVSFSSVAGFQNVFFNSLKLVPNPAKNWVQISGDFDAITAVKIFDVQGKLVKEIISFQDQINISDLKAGLYFVQITAANKTTSKKLVVY
ncbi:MAG: T9SS type A sorting domain-containing protein [Flavobacteriaceae bacterium]